MDEDERHRAAAIRDWHGRFSKWALAQGLISQPWRGRVPVRYQQEYIEATGDDLGAILEDMSAPEPQPTPYDWLEDDEWVEFGNGFTLTWVRGLAPHEVMARLGAFDITDEPLLVDDATSRGVGNTGRLAGAASLDPRWTVVCELMGNEGDVSIRGLSRGGEAVAVYTNINRHMRFTYSVDGEIVVAFDPMFPADRWGSDPDRLIGPMDALGLHTSGDHTIRSAELRALSLADHVTGAHVTPELLRGPFVWGEVRNIPSRTPPPPDVTLRARDQELADAITAADDARKARAIAQYLRHLAQDAGAEQEPTITNALAALHDHDTARLHALTTDLERLFITWKQEASTLPQLHMIDRRRDLDMLDRIRTAGQRGTLRRALQGALLSHPEQAACAALDEVSHMTVANQTRRGEVLTLLRSTDAQADAANAEG